MTKQKISNLVQKELEHDSLHHPNLGGVTRGGMANHYPMTILSLQGLGATDQEILNFKRYWPRYRALIKEDLQLKDSGMVQKNNWDQYLGQSQYLREFRRVFFEALEQQETTAVINQALTKMKNALPMGLFHPLIRLSFANSHGDKGQIADALAYMAIRYQDLYLDNSLDDIKNEANVSAQEIWQYISDRLNQSDLRLPVRRGSLNICEDLCAHAEIHQLAFNTGFNISIHNLNQRIQEICLLALRLYLYQPALTTLHAVTAAQALAELKQRQNLKKTQAQEAEIHVQLWRRYWVWLIALYIEKGSPDSLPDIDPKYHSEIQASSWDDLAMQARQIPEVHLIKMTYSCQWLAQELGPHQENSLYKLAVINMLREQQAHPSSQHGTIIRAS